MKLTLPWNKPHDNYLVLTGFVLLAEAAGILGSLFTFPAISSWYAYLNKPFFSPPNYLFGPVWTLLYLLMGISAYLVWRKYQFGKKSRAFWHVYWTQLILNSLWSILFFGFQLPSLAFFEILAMWYFIARTIQESRQLSPWSSYLFYPYILWVSFASLLNLSIWLLN
ncbi:MAG: integral membrane protein, tryptophan-rich sensory protein [Microgenomates group bacterium GW2011_GWC1_46_16]|nr:MAG: integral membrane protein, tryptophan-rich sensory protein [Microgenomates group bacterium GW2011_GWC1_46_16]HBO10883.1 TspO protein [Candidatus Collierbacteria bacterium]